MPEITPEPIIAYCGLVCSKCGSYLKGRCQGCHSSAPMFKNCPVKKCAADHAYTTCAACAQFSDLKQCRKLNNIISKLFGLIFRRNRIGHLNQIRAVGLDKFTAENG
jgi:hypothetical protein